jgi:hypothetical protein
MEKHSRIAVVIRGQKRVWDYVKENIFFNYSLIAHNIDYYFVTWESPVNSSIVSDFLDKNLVKFLELPTDENYELYGNAFDSPSFFAHSILPYIEAVSYDFIFDQRTDTFLFRRATPLIKSTTALYAHGKIFTNSIHLGNQIGDCGFMSDIVTYKLLSNRYLHNINRPKTPEAHLYNYCIANDIIILENSLYFSYAIVRPNISKHLLCSNLSLEKFKFLEDDWLFISDNCKKKYYKDCNIPSSEYSHWKYKIGK